YKAEFLLQGFTNFVWMCRQTNESYATDSKGALVTTPSVTLQTLAQLNLLKTNGGGCFGSGPGVLMTNAGELSFTPRWPGTYEFTATVWKGDRSSSAMFTINATGYQPPIMDIRYELCVVIRNE